MRDPARIEDILNKIKEIWERHPDLRLGQLICNAVPESILYYTEDDALIQAVEDLYRNL